MFHNYLSSLIFLLGITQVGWSAENQNAPYYNDPDTLPLFEKAKNNNEKLFHRVENIGKLARKRTRLAQVEINSDLLSNLVESYVTPLNDKRQMRKKMLSTESFNFPLPEDDSISFVFEKITVYDSRRFTLFGRSEVWGRNAQMVLSFSNDYFSGTVFADGKVYRLASQGKGMLSVEEQSQPMEQDDTIQPNFGLNLRQSRPRSLLTNALPATSDNPANIDVMILYTPKAKQAVGGGYAAEALAQSNVDALNLVFNNSKVYANANLVYVGEINIIETDDGGADIEEFSHNDEAQRLREKYGADLLQLTFYKGKDYKFCGLGYQPSVKHFEKLDWLSNQGFQISGHDCGDYTSVHEFGHNLGLGHNPEAADVNHFVYPWGFGHWASGKWTTMMSGGDLCTSSCPKVPYFSNPNLKLDGENLGVADKRDNARVLNMTTPIIAQYREAKHLARLSNITGLWYDTKLIGSGFNFLTRETKHALVFYGYNQQGQRLWLVSGEPFKLTAKTPKKIPLYENIAGHFSQPQHQLAPWGEITLTFNSCTQASATLEGKDGKFTYANLEPLVRPKDINCL